MFAERNCVGFCSVPVRPPVFFGLFHKRFVGPLSVLIMFCYVVCVSCRGLCVYVR